MCTVVILRRPDHDWPVIIGANRDEMNDRPWLPPKRHWDERDHVIAGMDVLAGGTWLGVNDDGLVAAILNRRNSLGPAPGLRSRGELPLEALDHAEAAIAAKALASLEPQSYRTFNLLIADAREAFLISSEQISDHADDKQISVQPLPEGISMISAQGLNTEQSSRQKYYAKQFQIVSPPDPTTDNWAEWEQMMASRKTDPLAGPDSAMNVMTDFGFQTICSSLIALPNPQQSQQKPIWRFAVGAPDEAEFKPISTLES